MPEFKFTNSLDNWCKVLVRIIKIATSFLFFLSPIDAISESPRTVQALFAGIKTDEPDTASLVISLLDAYLLLKEGIVIGRAADTRFSELNFYCASGVDYFIDQMLTPKALTGFDFNAVGELIELPTNTETCYVQFIVLSEGSQRLLLAVHNEDDDDPEDVFRCLIAGLWRFQGRDLKDLDIADWRRSFTMLIRND